MEHVNRIARILNITSDSVLFVNIGGYGKQSLAKLSSYIMGYDVVRIFVTISYKMADLKPQLLVHPYFSS